MLRPVTATGGSSIGVVPLILNSQSSCAGCQASFVNPGLVTVPAHAPADWWVSRPGSAPWSIVIAARVKKSVPGGHRWAQFVQQVADRELRACLRLVLGLAGELREPVHGRMCLVGEQPDASADSAHAAIGSRSTVERKASGMTSRP